MTVSPDQIYFDADSGDFLQRAQPRPIERVEHFITGLHRVQLDSWALRFMYFSAGLGRCVLIATGFLFGWKHAAHNTSVIASSKYSARSATGIITATLAFVANRCLLPVHISRSSIASSSSFGCCALLLLALRQHKHAAAVSGKHMNRATR